MTKDRIFKEIVQLNCAHGFDRLGETSASTHWNLFPVLYEYKISKRVLKIAESFHLSRDYTEAVSCLVQRA